MKKAASFFFALLLFTVPLFYHPALFFPERAKWAWAALLLPLPFLLGPALAAFRGVAFAFPQPRLPILALAIWTAASGLWAGTKELWAVSLATLLLGIAIASTASWIGSAKQEDSDEAWPWLAGPLLAAGCLASAIGLLESLGMDLLGHPFDTRLAPVATFGNTNHAGEFLAPLATIAFALAVTQRGVWGHFGMIALFLISAYLSALGVRAAWIASGAGLVFVSWLLWRGLTPKQRSLLLAPCIAAAAGFLAPRLLAPPPIGQAPAASARSTDTIEVRKKVYASTWRMILDQPLLGCGAGNFQAAFPPYRDPEEIEISSHRRADPAESMVEEPHNDYLLFAAELGLAGAAIVACLGYCLLRGAKIASHSLGASMALAGLVALGVNALFRSPLTNPSSSIAFWCLLGMLGAQTRIGEPAAGRRNAWLSAFGLAILVLIAYGGFRALDGEISLARGEQARAAFSDSWDPRKWEILGLREKLAKNREGAEFAYQRLLALNPDHFNGRLQSGLLAAERDAFAQATEHLEAAARLDTNNPRLFKAQALLAYREGDDLAAISLLRRAYERGARDPLRNFGEEIEKAGQAERALKYYQAHVELNPEDAKVWFAMGQIFRNREDEAESRRDFARAHRLYGVEHLRAGKAVDAERQFQLYKKFSLPQDPAPDLFLAAVALQLTDRVMAAASLRDARAKGAKQESLRAAGLEMIAADAELRSLLPK